MEGIHCAAGTSSPCLNPSENACAQEAVAASVMESIQDATVRASFATAQPIFMCIESENLRTIFARVIDSRLDGLSDETHSCSENVLIAAQVHDPHPRLIEFSLGGTDEAPEHFDQAIALSRQPCACMNNDELLEAQKVIADSLHRE